MSAFQQLHMQSDRNLDKGQRKCSYLREFSSPLPHTLRSCRQCCSLMSLLMTKQKLKLSLMMTKMKLKLSLVLRCKLACCSCCRWRMSKQSKTLQKSFISLKDLNASNQMWSKWRFSDIKVTQQILWTLDIRPTHLPLEFTKTGEFG